MSANNTTQEQSASNSATRQKARLTTELIEAITTIDTLISDRNAELQSEILKLKAERLKVKNARKADSKAIIDESKVEVSKKIIQIKRKQINDLKAKREDYEYNGIPEPAKKKKVTDREKIGKLKNENNDLKENVKELNAEVKNLKRKLNDKQDTIKTQGWEIKCLTEEVKKSRGNGWYLSDTELQNFVNKKLDVVVSRNISFK